ncbi:MAG: hypothetical protein ACR2NA_08080 [Solirubrobacterales bacterium]
MPSTGGESLGAAARELRDEQLERGQTFSQAIRTLRDAERRHAANVREAEHQLAEARTADGDVETARRHLEEVHAEGVGLGDGRLALERLHADLPADEEITDVAPALRQGEDGLMIVTSGRVAFLGPRRSMNVDRRAICGAKVRGLFGRRALVLETTQGKRTLGGIEREHARELADRLCPS